MGKNQVRFNYLLELDEDYTYHKHGFDDDLLDEEDLLNNDPNIETITVVQNSRYNFDDVNAQCVYNNKYQNNYGNTYTNNSSSGTKVNKVDEDIKNSFKNVGENSSPTNENKTKNKNKLDDIFGANEKNKTIPHSYENKQNDTSKEALPVGNKHSKIIKKKVEQKEEKEKEKNAHEENSKAKLNCEIDPNDFDRKVNITNESNLIFTNEENQFENLNRNNYNNNYNKQNRFQNKNKFNNNQNYIPSNYNQQFYNQNPKQNYYNQMNFYDNNINNMQYGYQNNPNYNEFNQFYYPPMNNQFNPNFNFEAEQQAYQQYLYYQQNKFQNMMPENYSQGYNPYNGNGVNGQNNN